MSEASAKAEPFVAVGDLLQSHAIDELAVALVAFQADATHVEKSGEAEAGRNRQRSYAKLSDAWAAARKPLTEHGLSVMQWPSTPGQGWISVTTRVLHKSGQWMQSSLKMAIDPSAHMNETQRYGSAITYACRYAFMAALGLPPATDDDGQAAGGEPGRPAPPRDDLDAGRSRSRSRAKKNTGTQALEKDLKTVRTWDDYRGIRQRLEKLSDEQKELIKPAVMDLHKALSDSKCPECKKPMPLGDELCERCAPPAPPRDAPPPLAEEPGVVEVTTPDGVEVEPPDGDDDEPPECETCGLTGCDCPEGS